MIRLTPILLALLLAGCPAASKPEVTASPPADGSLSLTPAAQAAVQIATAPVVAREVHAQQAVIGQITYRPEAEAVVHTPVTGRVTQLMGQVGDRVAAGAVLALLASAELGDAQAAYLQAEGEQRLAAAEQARQARLFKADLASVKERDAATQAAAGARIRAQAARERLRVLGVDDAQAATLVRRGRVDPTHRILAPRPGTIVERGVTLGDMAAPGDATPMFRLLDLRTVRVEVDLPERDMLAVTPGAPATVSVAALGDRPVTGHVARLAPTLDRDTRTGRALIDVPNPDGRLKPGMSCKAVISAGRHHVLVIPAAAVQREAEKAFAYVVLPNARYRERTLVLGARYGDVYEVISGLRAGEIVATTGSFDLRGLARQSELGGN